MKLTKAVKVIANDIINLLFIQKILKYALKIYPKMPLKVLIIAKKI